MQNYLKQCEYFLNEVKLQEVVNAICFLMDNKNKTSSQSKEKKIKSDKFRRYQVCNLIIIHLIK